MKANDSYKRGVAWTIMGTILGLMGEFRTNGATIKLNGNYEFLTTSHTLGLIESSLG